DREIRAADKGGDLREDHDDRPRAVVFDEKADPEPQTDGQHDFGKQHQEHDAVMGAPIGVKRKPAEQHDRDYAQEVDEGAAEHFADKNFAFADRGGHQADRGVAG